jgi:hypothetical protein
VFYERGAPAHAFQMSPSQQEAVSYERGGVSDVEPGFLSCIEVRKTGVCGP